MSRQTRMPQVALNSLVITGFKAWRAKSALSQALNFRLTPGSVLGVVGPNGIGKSSLLGALAGTGVEYSGSAQLGLRDLRTLSAKERAQHISFLPQDTSAPPELVVRELVAIGAHAARRPDPVTAARRALLQLNLESIADHRFGTLSGGQRQLVHLARVLAQDTPVIILDEPTSALDLRHEHDIDQLLNELSKMNKIVITAVHDLSFALNVCTDILLLTGNGGALFGPPSQVLQPDRVLAAYGVHTAVHTTPNGRTVLTRE